jgi:menaquinol-cytochrome c reductase iron-sulfur subunit
MNDQEARPRRDDPVGRREFLKRATVIIAAPIVVVLGWPLVESLFGGLARKTEGVFSMVSGFASAPLGQPVKLHFLRSRTDLFLRQGVVEDVWVVKHSPASATVFSPICPHLGCRFEWVPAQRQFVCPCHRSVFSEDGAVLSGPAPRPLDPLPFRINDGMLWVEWERFKPGVLKMIRVG